MPNQKGFSPVLIIVFTFVILAIAGGSYYFFLLSKTNAVNSTLQNQAEVKVQATSSPVSSPTLSDSTPEQVVTGYIQALQKNNKKQAQSYISSTADRTNFRTTFDDAEPSWFSDPTTTYKVNSADFSQDGTKAFVKVDTKVNNLDLFIITVLDSSNGAWAIADQETILRTNDPQEPRSNGDLNPRSFYRTLIIIEGNVNFNLESPEGTFIGTDPTGKVLQEISDTSLTQNGDTQSLAIRDLAGFWKLKLVGKTSGSYKLVTQVVESQEQKSILSNAINQDETQSFYLKYPKQKGQLIKVIPLK